MASLLLLSQTPAPCTASVRPIAPRTLQPQSQPRPRPCPAQQLHKPQQQRSLVCSSLPHDSPSLSSVPSSGPPSLPSTTTTTSAFLLGRNATTRSALRRTLKASRKSVGTTALAALLQCDPQLQTACPIPNNTSLEHELYKLSNMLKQLSEQASVSGAVPSTKAAPAAATAVPISLTSTPPPTPAPARAVYNPVISCASLLPPAAFPTALQLQLPPSASGRLLVCQGSKCQAAGSMDTLRTASALVSSSPGLEVLPSKCLGKCKLGPVMRIKRTEGEAAPGTDPRGQMYTQVVAERVGQALYQEFPVQSC